MSDYETYNIAAIRRLLFEAFTREDLLRFCRDRSEFRPVVDRFGPGYGLDDMVDLIIDYCRTRLLFDELLAEVKMYNPRQYERHESYLDAGIRERKVGSREKIARRRKEASSDQYDLAAIRRLIMVAFTPEALNRFCQDHPLFRPVLYDVPARASLPEMANALITYCAMRGLFPELLSEIELYTPHQYARYRPELLHDESLTAGAQELRPAKFWRTRLRWDRKWAVWGAFVLLSITGFVLLLTADWSRLNPSFEDAAQFLRTHSGWIAIFAGGLIILVILLLGVWPLLHSRARPGLQLLHYLARLPGTLRRAISSSLAEIGTFFRERVLVGIQSLARKRSRFEAEPELPFRPPRPLAGFAGRTAETLPLVRTLNPGSKVAITGLEGVGKTELAKRLAAEVAGRFRDGVLWADCRQQDLMLIADLWATAYGIQLPGNDQAAKAAAWQGLISGKEALLVFDDIQPGQQIELLFPAHGLSGILITSRGTDHSALRGAERLSLTPFTPDEAHEFAEKVLGQRVIRTQAAAANQLLVLSGHLPLALSLALHLAKECGLPLDNLNAKLEQISALETSGKESRVHRTLQGLLEITWENLPDELKEAFQALALLDKGSSFSTKALSQILGLEEPEACACLQRLREWSLLTQVSERRWALQPLLRDWVGTRPQIASAARARMARHYLDVARAADDLYQQGGDNRMRGLLLFDLEWPHIYSGQAWSAACVEDNDEAARLCSEYPDASVNCLSLRLPPRQWVEWLEDSIRAAHRLGDKATEGKRLNRLGNAYAELGDVRQAMECQERAVGIQREIGDQRAEGDSLSSLGSLYLRLGDVGRAVDNYEQALVIHRRVGDRRGEGSDLANLGVAHSMKGEYEQAIEYYEQASVVHGGIGDRFGIGEVQANLGHVHLLQGNAKQAIDCYNQALTISREVGDRHSEGNWLSGLGVARAAAGEKQEAIACYQQALSIHREIGDLRGECADLINNGTAYAELGEAKQAIEIFSQALTIARMIGDRRSEANVLDILGSVHARLEETRRATDCYQQALVIYRETGDLLGEANNLLHLGDLCAAQQEYWQAVAYYEHALPIHRKIQDRLGEGNTLSNLGSVFASLGELPRAIEHHEQALAIHREVNAQDRVAGDLANLGSACASLGENHRAVEYFQSALGVHQQIGDQPAEEIDLASLGATYASLGDTWQAAGFYLQALNVSRELRARDREMRYLATLGQAYQDLNQPLMAIEYYEQALELADELTDRDTQEKSLRALSLLYQASGSVEQTLARNQQLFDLYRNAQELDKAAATLLSMGTLAREDKQYDRAERIWLQCRELYTELQSPVAASIDALLNELQMLRASTLSLEEMARRFFDAAGFALSPGHEVATILCCPDPQKWQDQLMQPIPVLVLSGTRLDGATVRALCQSELQASDDKPVIFVVIDQAPTDDGWLQIATMRAEGAHIIPMDDALLLEGQEKRDQRQRLAGYLNHYLRAKQDLYNIRHPVADRLNFFGRELLADELMEQLSEGRPVALFGLRKMGKSSVLKYVRDKLPYPTAIVDLEAGVDLQDLYTRILTSWAGSIQVKIKGQDWSPPDLPHTRGVSSAFAAATRQLLTLLKDQGLTCKVCLLVDEMEVLFPHDDENVKQYLAFTRTLRGLVQEQEGAFSLLVASLEPSFNRVNRVTSHQNPFYQFFREIYLPALESEDCMHMISVIGRQMGLEYSEEAARFVARISGGHPFFARQLCSLAFRGLGHDGDVPLSHLEVAADRFIREPGQSELLDERGLWGEISDPEIWPEPQVTENQAVLRSLAKTEPQPERDLVAQAQDLRACERSLDELEKRDVLGKPEPTLFDIQLQIFGNWIRRYKLTESN